MNIIPSYVGLWLLQIVCILFPTVLYQSFFRRKYGHVDAQKVIFSVLCGISIIICMTFPVSINKDYILDFRFIPLIIAFIFGGFRVGLVLSIILVAYRFIIGGVGFYLGGLWMTVFLLVAFAYILPRLENWNEKWKKVYPYVLLTFTLVFFALGTQFFDDYSFNSDELILWSWFSILNYLTFGSVKYLQSSIRSMEIMTEKVIQFEKNHTINHMLVYISQQMVQPVKSAENFLDKIREEPLTSSQSFHLLQTKNELIQAVRCLEHYQTFMGEVGS